MSILGREIAPSAAIGRPRFRDYPGPPTGAILFIPFAALAAFGFLTFRAQLSPGFYWFMAFCAAFMLAVALITFAIWLRFGVTLSLHELGVVLQTHAIPYAEIDAVTIHDKRRYDETATVRALTRTVTIEAAGRKVKAVYVARPGEVLDDLLDRLAQRIAAEPRPRAGNGWRIEQATLHARGGMVPLSAISAAGVFERNVRLWKHNDEQHFFTVPFDSKNARVLLALTSRGAAGFQPAEPTIEPTPSTGIGRLLFARRTSLVSVLGNTILAAFAIALGWLGIEKFLPELGLGREFIIGASVLWILYSIYRATVRYRFHERALIRISLLGTRTLAYTNVRAMTWSETAQSLEHAIPLGTSVKAKLVPKDGTSALSIRLHRFRGQDGDLEPVRSAIAQNIAAHLRKHVERGEEVQWTKKVKFTREGLIVKRELLPYDQPIGILFRQGYLMFYRETWRKPLVLINASEGNFYPCLALFEMLMRNVVTEVEQTA